MSKIKFLEEMFIECCIGFDDFGDPIMEEEKVLKGEGFEVDIVSGEVDEDIIQIRFGNGSVSFIDRNDIQIDDPILPEEVE
jgi:hypothetical protein